MHKKTGLLLMGIGAVLLVAALSLLLFNRAEDKNAGDAAEDVLSAVIAAIKTPGDSTDSTPDLENVAEPDTEMTVVEIDGYKYIGYLSIPVLELELPIMSEWDYTRLKIAPCRYFGSTKTDDMVLCGHNYTRHFGPLKKLQAGDLVFFTGLDGVTISYEVEDVEILKPTQMGELIESGYDLTLYTCTYGGQSRVTVRCNRAEKE